MLVNLFYFAGPAARAGFIIKQHAVARFFIEMAFNGEAFHGWQKQRNAVTIQQNLEQALTTLFQQPIDVTGAGRTDTGVHASYYVAHFDAPELPFEALHLIKKLNSFLPPGIVIYTIQQVKEEVHARYSAISRTYRYQLVLTKNPFLDRLSYRPWFIPDLDEMNRAARGMLNYTDFTSFARLHSDAKTNICNVSSAFWEEQNGGFIFEVKANRFLRNMVRAMVGTLLEVGRGKITVNEFFDIIEARDRSRAGTSAPPQGLFLVDIEYPAEVFTGTCPGVGYGRIC